MPEIVTHSLSDYIAAQDAQVGSSSDLPEGVSLGDAGEGQIALTAGGSGAAVAPAPAPESVGVTPAPNPPPPTPTIDPGVLQQLQQVVQQQQQQLQQQQQINQQLNLDRLNADEERFLQSIAHLPYDEQMRLATERENGQLQQLVRYYHGQATSVQQQQAEAQRQADVAGEITAKRMVAFMKAGQAGLDPYDPAVQEIMLNARTPDDMDRYARLLSGAQPSGPQIIAGGARAAAPQGAAMPRRGSGDLSGYIANIDYQLVPVE